MTRKPHDLSDAEEMAIRAQIAADPDDTESTDDELAHAKPFAEAFPVLMESIRRSRGRPKTAEPKEAVTLRLDPATLARFKAKGTDWRNQMADVLRKAKV